MSAVYTVTRTQSQVDVMYSTAYSTAYSTRDTREIQRPGGFQGNDHELAEGASFQQKADRRGV